ADALIIDYNNKKCFLIEFKNCSKSTLIDNYIDGKDSVIVKYKNSKNIIKSINVDGFDSESIISQTEVALVYNKNDSAGSVTTSFPAKRITTKDSNNKQSRATTKRNKIGSACRYKFEMGSTKKRTEDSLNSFRKKVKALGFSSCCLLDRKQTNVAILGADDFSDLINKGIFEQIDWGIYKSFWAPQ
ncbi:MAG: hypothetical protein J5864_08365, partial [Oscillospiraceae bacterium]|nr:hypothetical protein [Oscillospiraceae bacterium]